MKAGCLGCKFWSERMAQSIGGGPVEAMCLNEQSPHYNRYVHRGCEHFVLGDAIDDPYSDEDDDD